MRTPRLNRLMELEARESAPDGAGGFAGGWVTRGLLWAAVLPGAAGERAGVGTALSRTVHRIAVRAAPVGSSARPVAGQRFREGSRRFRILSVTEHDPDGRFLLCLTEEETAT
jgi:head-tail adaptor